MDWNNEAKTKKNIKYLEVRPDAIQMAVMHTDMMTSSTSYTYIKRHENQQFVSLPKKKERKECIVTVITPENAV